MPWHGNLMDDANRLGDDGWELINFASFRVNEGVVEFKGVFKRPCTAAGMG